MNGCTNSIYKSTILETAHFSNIREEILKRLDQAEQKIKVAVCWFTNDRLFSKLCEKVNAKVTVEVIILNDFINNRADGLNFQHFIDIGGQFYFGDNEKPMHNKYCLIDDRVLINGSYNWTFPAEKRNHENVIIHEGNPVIVKKFDDDFERIKSSLLPVKKVSAHSISEIADFNFLDARNYLAYDYLYKAQEEGNPLIVEKALNLLPDNIQLQKKTVDLNLKARQKTISSIGETVHNGQFIIVFPRGTEIPCVFTRTFTSVFDGQPSVLITVAQGESPKGSENIQLGTFTVKGIPPMKAGEPKLDTTYTINIFGILYITKHLRGTDQKETWSCDVKNLLIDL